MKSIQILVFVGVLGLCAFLVLILFSSSINIPSPSKSNNRAGKSGADSGYSASENSSADSENFSEKESIYPDGFRTGGRRSGQSTASNKKGDSGGKSRSGVNNPASSSRSGKIDGSSEADMYPGEAGDASSKAGRYKPGVRIITKEDFQLYIDAVVESPEEESPERKLGIVAGYVVDENGSAVGGALVTLTLEINYFDGRGEEENASSKFPRRTRTDPGGQFWFSCLPFTSYSIKVECQGYLTEYFAAIRLDEKGEVYLEVVMRNNLVISGIVIDNNNNPVQGARVTTQYAIEVGPVFTAETYTDFGGDFTLPVREGSSNEVEATKIGYQPVKLLSIEPGTEDLRLVLVPVPTGLVTGRVVCSSTGFPINEITIDGESLFAGDGYFEIERQVSSQNQQIVIGAEGYLPKTVKFKLTESGSVDLGEIALQVEITLKGMVVMAETEPPEAVSGASVTISYDGKNPRTTNTGGDGTFAFDGIIPGTLTLTAAANGFFPESRQVIIENYDPENPATKEVHVVVNLAKGGYAVIGTVTDSQTTEPIEGASIELVEAPFYGTTTEADGKYLMEGISLDSFKLRASKAGYASATSALLPSESEGSSIVCNFTLEPGGFSGKLFQRGVPVPEGTDVFLWKKIAGTVDVRLAAEAKLDENRLTTKTEKEGQFSFNNIADGDYFLVVPDYQLWSLPVTVDSESSLPVNIEVPGVSEIRGKITYADGSPVANTTLYLHSGDNDYSIAAYHTDEQGNYIVKNVALRNHALSIIKSIADQSAQHVVKFPVTSSPVHLMDIKMPSLSCSITGRLTDENGSPKPGVRVGVEYLDNSHREILAGWVLTDAQGKYSVPRLEVGRHIVRTAWTDDEVVFSDIIELEEGESKEVNLVAPRVTGKTITGNLITSDGSPIAGSFVFAIDSDGRQSGNFFGNFNWGYASYFDVKGLEPDNYTLVFTAIGCKKKSVNISVNDSISGLTVIMERE